MNDDRPLQIMLPFDGDKSIQERFEEFHHDNPMVYTGLVRLARRAVAAGQHKIGIELLFAVLRWEQIVDTTGHTYKLNDHFTSRYARLIMEQEPDLAGLFETRRLKAA